MTKKEIIEEYNRLLDALGSQGRGRGGVPLAA